MTCTPVNLTHVPHGELLSPYYHRTWRGICDLCPPEHRIAVGYAHESGGWIVSSLEEWLWACSQNPASAFTCFIPPGFGPGAANGGTP